MKKLLFLACLIGCGSYDDESPKRKPAPAPPSSSNFDAIKPVIDEQCALFGCHAGTPFLATERAFKASRSAELIANDKMPLRSSPNYDLWTDAKKADLLDFLVD